MIGHPLLSIYPIYTSSLCQVGPLLFVRGNTVGVRGPSRSGLRGLQISPVQNRAKTLLLFGVKNTVSDGGEYIGDELTIAGAKYSGHPRYEHVSTGSYSREIDRCPLDSCQSNRSRDAGNKRRHPYWAARSTIQSTSRVVEPHCIAHVLRHSSSRSIVSITVNEGIDDPPSAARREDSAAVRRLWNVTLRWR